MGIRRPEVGKWLASSRSLDGTVSNWSIDKGNLAALALLFEGFSIGTLAWTVLWRRYFVAWLLGNGLRGHPLGWSWYGYEMSSAREDSGPCYQVQ